VAVDFQVGDRSRLHCTSIGKALLAWQEPAEIEAVMAAGLPALTANTITEPEALRRELGLVRERGYAIDDREMYDNMRCIAVPVFERDVPVRMGISCSTDGRSSSNTWNACASHCWMIARAVPDAVGITQAAAPGKSCRCGRAAVPKPVEISARRSAASWSGRAEQIGQAERAAESARPRGQASRWRAC
jgi:hypothetical protein